MTRDDHEQVLDVARSLATWFHPLDQMTLSIDLREHTGMVAEEQGEVVGFLTYRLLSDTAAELSWLGVREERQSEGIGGLLLESLERLLRRNGVETLELSTVPADHEPAFELTNRFYRRRGYTVEQREDHFYAYGRPRILLRKRLAS